MTIDIKRQMQSWYGTVPTYYSITTSTGTYEKKLLIYNLIRQATQLKEHIQLRDTSHNLLVSAVQEVDQLLEG